jgi:hypothetical protein
MRPSRMTLNKDAEIVLSRFAFSSVMSNFASSGFEHRYSVSAYNTIQCLSPETAKSKS